MSTSRDTLVIVSPGCLPFMPCTLRIKDPRRATLPRSDCLALSRMVEMTTTVVPGSRTSGSSTAHSGASSLTGAPPIMASRIHSVRGCWDAGPDSLESR
eukprot:3458378-Prymnesium_polylepis.2